MAKFSKKIVYIVLALLILSLCSCASYSSLISAESDAVVNVIQIKEGYFFDGPGSDSALIFYPGGKVQDVSYADLLRNISQKGVDCFLVHMPLDLAMFGYNRADGIMQSYDYDHWYIGGHSLGGVFACYYAKDKASDFDGIVLLASYTSKDLSDTDLDILLLYGSEDKVLNEGAIEKSKPKMPASYTEVCIEGGNHAQFGDYGNQKGDGEALISSAEQKRLASELIADFIL